MKRRDFLKSTALMSGLAATAMPLAVNAAETVSSTPAAREFYELRRYRFRSGEMASRFEDYAARALVPALNRLGLEPVGVFNDSRDGDEPSAHVLIPGKSVAELAGIEARLLADSEYQQQGAGFLKAPPGDPPYVRVESSLFQAFSGMPRLEVPARKTEGKSRLFELRIYESHSKPANLKKIGMFNEGEIAIFRRTGLAPVFFGEALVGGNLPNLTYLLAFDDRVTRDRNWGVFSGDAAWKKLRSTPGYADAEIVSHITNVFLTPAACSQI